MHDSETWQWTADLIKMLCNRTSMIEIIVVWILWNIKEHRT